MSLAFKDANGRAYPKWEEKRLGEVCECLDSKRIPLNKSQRSKMQGKFPYCGANGVLDYVNDYIFDDTLVLLAEDGGYFSDYQNRPVAYLMKGKFWVNNHAHILKAKNGSTEFLLNRLAHFNFNPYLSSPHRPKLNKGVLLDIKLQIPTLPEQCKIADFFSKIDEKIALAKSALETAKALKKAYLQRIFSGELAFTDSGKPYPKWEEKEFKEYFKVLSGKKYQIPKKKYVSDGEIPVVDQGAKFIAGYTNDRSKIYPNNGGVIIFGDHTRIIKFINFDFAIGADGTQLLKTQNGVNLKFAYFALENTRIQSLGYSRHLKVLKELNFPLPTLPEQRKIADFFSALDKKISLKEKKLSTLNSLKKALLQAIF